MKDFGKLISYKTENNIVSLEYENGNARIEVIRDDIINLFSAFESEEHYSKSIEGNKAVKTDFSVEKTKSGITVSTAKAKILISDGLMTEFYDKNGICLSKDSTEERKAPQTMTEDEKRQLRLEGHSVAENYTDFRIFLKKEIEGDECFYGLGDKTGFLNKKNYQYKMWNTDNPQPHVDFFEVLYKSIPFLITLKNNGIYGMFFDNTDMSVFNLGQENPKFFWYGTTYGNLDCYYIAGENFKDILSAYTYLTGTVPLPQMWTLGYQQSRFGYMNENDILTVAKNMRKYQIPCDAIHFDIDYMDSYKVFTYDQKRYSNFSETIKKLNSDGFKAVTIIDPGVKVEKGYKIFDEGIRNDYFCKDKNGIVYVNTVWPGDSVFPDFGNPKVREWWGDNHKEFIDFGVSGIWNDMNEPASFNGALPDDVIMADEDRKSNHRRMHNVYGHNMIKATYEGLKKNTGKRPFLITRACYAGSQKYSTAWTGDNASIWSHLRMVIPQLCNLGLSGMAFVGTDIGGFGANTTPELMARWIELGAFSPLCRNHCSKGRRNQEPWCFGDEVLDVYRKFVNLRYALLPYFYDNFRICEEHGYPIMRPLVFNYCHDENVKNINDEFMIGDNLLVAPVVEQGATHKCVYLPEGDWVDYYTGIKVSGGKRFIRKAMLDECPIYVKSETILPKYDVQNYIGEKENDTLYLEIYGSKANYQHYTDNGSDFKYRDGEYNLYDFKYENGEFSARLVKNGYNKVYKKIVVTKFNTSIEKEFKDGLKINI